MNRNNTKNALLISLIYLLCFQVFLQSGYYGWLYAGNVLFCAGMVLYTIRHQAAHPALSLPVITGKSIRFSLVASLIALAGSLLLCMFNYYLFPHQQMEYSNLLKGNLSVYAGIRSIADFVTLAFTNSFPINLVGGSLVSFFIAGIVNEKNQFNSSQPLSSVKLDKPANLPQRIQH
jgi:hypothetical protein